MKSCYPNIAMHNDADKIIRDFFQKEGNDCPQRRKKKLIVFGIDGADHEIISGLIAEGRLKNFAKVINEGSSGELISAIMPVSPAAWASFFTGKNPGKHGIFGWTAFNKDTCNNATAVDSNSFLHPTIWELFQKSGERIFIFNALLFYPLPQGVNGYLISGLDTPSDASCASDRGLDNLLKGLGYRPGLVISASAVSIENAISEADRQTAIAESFLKFADCSVFMIHNHLIDTAMHNLKIDDQRCEEPHKHKRGWINFTDSEKEQVCRIYQKVDEYVGNIYRLKDEDTVFLLMSDHGMSIFKRQFNIYRWLEKEKFFDIKLPEKLKLEAFKYARIVKRQLIGSQVKVNFLRVPMLWADFLSVYTNWRKTKAFIIGYHSNYFLIRINLKGRERYGQVLQEEYEDLCNEISRRLKELEDPAKKVKVVRNVWRKEEVYSGSDMPEETPDIIIELDEKYYVDGNYTGSNSIFTDMVVCTHRRRNGFFCAAGSGIKRGERIPALSIMDPAPTLLYALGIPVLDDMDGKILKEIFAGENLEEPHYESYKIKKRRVKTEYSESVKERLRSLGYI